MAETDFGIRVRTVNRFLQSRNEQILPVPVGHIGEETPRVENPMFGFQVSLAPFLQAHAGTYQRTEALEIVQIELHKTEMVDADAQDKANRTDPPSAWLEEPWPMVLGELVTCCPR